MVIMLQTLLELLQVRKGRVLDCARLAMPEAQFKAFRKMFLDEFGQRGLEGELVRLEAEQRQPKHWNGRE